MIDLRSVPLCLLACLLSQTASADDPPLKTAPRTVPPIVQPKTPTVPNRTHVPTAQADRLRSVSYGADIAIERFTVSETNFVFESPDDYEQVRVSCRLKNLGLTDSGPVALTLTIHTAPSVGGPRAFTKTIQNVVAGQSNNPPGWSYTETIRPDLSAGASGVRVPVEMSCEARPLEHETGVWAENNRETVTLLIQKAY